MVLRDRVADASATLRRLEPQVRTGDPEAVHAFRVCARNLRSVLGVLGGTLDESTVSFLRSELRRLGNASNRARDVDVLRATLLHESSRLSDVDTPALAVLFRELDDQAAVASAEMVAALDDPRTETLLAGLDRIASLAPDRMAAADGDERRARRRVRTYVRKQARHLHHYRATLGAHPSPAKLHRLRLLTKRYRYALDAIGPISGRSTLPIGKALARLQDALGATHDAAVVEDWLRGVAGGHPECAVAVGQLLAHVRRDEPRRWKRGLRRLEAAERGTWLGRAHSPGAS